MIKIDKLPTQKVRFKKSGTRGDKITSYVYV
jgi:hypothetical protein